MKYITRQEEYVLLSVRQLKENAYLVEIQKYLNKVTKKNWSISSVYVPLDKLERSGYLKTRVGEPTAQRGGKAIKYYSLTEEGLNALAAVKKVHDALWIEQPDLAFEK
jgi:DNA-binding PadR family transcriptional regulator